MRSATARGVVWTGLVLVAVVVLWKGWVTDDAYITFRTSQNVVEGRGATWNPDERVQAYTHPSWMLLAAAGYAVTGEFFYTAIALNLACTLAAVWLLAFRVASSWRTAALGLALLAASRAFTDFSTSGLENALVHLLLVSLLVARRPVVVALLAGLCLLTRPDLALLVGAAVLAALWRFRRRDVAVSAIVGLAPVVAWEAFSIVYYGSFLPNTAFAKLSTGIPAADLAAQGVRYLRNSLVLDPPTLVVVAAALALVLADTLWVRGASVPPPASAGGDDRSPAAASTRGALVAAPPWSWALGIVLSLGYVVRVGGDFMSGRFLTPAFVVAVGLVIAMSLPPRAVLAATAAALALLAVPWTTPFIDRDYGDEWHAAIDLAGIADERSFYGRRADLWSSFALHEKWPDPKSFEEARWLHRKWPHDYFVDDLLYVGTLSPAENWPPPGPLSVDGTPYRTVIVRGAVGFLGYHLGPQVHVLDYHGITDPLLARLPMTRPDPIMSGLLPKLAARGWRVGHYYRRPPVGYVTSLATDTNAIRDPDLRAYYDVLRRITRGPVFERERLTTIARFQLGAYDELLARAAAR